MKYILNNDNLEVVGKQYLNGVGGYTGTNTGGSKDVATVINNKADKTDIVIATNDDIDALFDVNDYYNYSIEPTSETYSLRDNKSMLYYTSDNMNTDFIAEQEYFENNKCLSHMYDENLSVGVITFSGEIPSKEEIQKQYMIEIDYIEYE